MDNGTEFHDYAAIERETATRFYFATPHHSWERGTNENTNGLLRQYLRKATLWRTSPRPRVIASPQTQPPPRKRLLYRTPEECYAR